MAHKSVNGRAERLCNEIMKQLGFGADVTMLFIPKNDFRRKVGAIPCIFNPSYSSEALDCRPYEVSDRLQNTLENRENASKSHYY